MNKKEEELQWFEKLPKGVKHGERPDEKKLRLQQNASRMKPQVNLEKHTGEAYRWLNEIAGTIGARSRLDWAYHALRGVLHALRDRMPPEEVFQLSAQLPLLIRGIYFEGYQITGKPDKLSKEELLERIEGELGPGHVIMARTAFMAVLNILYNHVARGEMDDIYATMPKDIKELWDRSMQTTAN